MDSIKFVFDGFSFFFLERERERERERETLKLYHKNTCFKYVLMKSFYSDFACLLSSENWYIYLFTFYFFSHTWYLETVQSCAAILLIDLNDKQTVFIL